MIDTTNFTTSINEMRYQNNNNNDNKTSCFILKTFFYQKRRRREKNTTMTMIQHSSVTNDNNNEMEKIHCLLCRKIIESNVYDYQHQLLEQQQQEKNININNHHQNTNPNICIECSINNINKFNNTIIDDDDIQQNISHEDESGHKDNKNRLNNKNLSFSEDSCKNNNNSRISNKNNYNKCKSHSEMCKFFIIYLIKNLRKSLLVLLLFNSLVMFSSIQIVNAQNNSKFNSNVTAEPGGELFFFIIYLKFI